MAIRNSNIKIQFEKKPNTFYYTKFLKTLKYINYQNQVNISISLIKKSNIIIIFINNLIIINF